jgi:acetyl-CoA synthetase
MDYRPIAKSSAYQPPPNLLDYEATQRTFSWAMLEQELHGSRHQGLNIADLAIDRHTAGKRVHQTALRFIDQNWHIRDFSYQDLQEETNRFANVLDQLEVGKGDRVFALSGRIPSLYIAALETLKHGSVFCPLFSAFEPEPIFQSMERGDARYWLQRPYSTNKR